jgi:hypothetical protein
MKAWLRDAPPALKPALLVYITLLGLFLLSGAIAILGAPYWLRTGKVFMLFLPVVVYIGVKLYLNFVMLPLGAVLAPVKSADEAVGIPRVPDETKIQDAKNALDALGGEGTHWIDDAVREWLATPEGIERDRKRNTLLERLYAYASSSSDDYAHRAAANRLRLAVNPWVESKD